MKVLLEWLIQLYRLCISPLIGPCCRFYPSCSQYALDALHTHKLPKAVRLIISRLLRCSGASYGGVDLVPPSTEDSSRDS